SLSGDVETIVLKALEKDRSRRYHTAGELAADVSRFLDYEPITARPPSTWYSLKKFARRNKMLVAGGATLFLVLLSAVVVSTFFAVHAQRQRRAAQMANDNTQAVNDFLNEMLASADPGAETNPNHLRDITMQQVIDRAARGVGERFKDTPLIEA